MHTEASLGRWLFVFVMLAACTAGTHGSQLEGNTTNGGNGTAQAGTGPTITVELGGSSVGGATAGSGGSAGTGPDCEGICQGLGTCAAGVCVIQQNPGNLDPGTRGTLTSGGTVDPAFKFLYPYDRT